MYKKRPLTSKVNQMNTQLSAPSFGAQSDVTMLGDISVKMKRRGYPTKR